MAMAPVVQNDTRAGEKAGRVAHESDCGARQLRFIESRNSALFCVFSSR